MTETVKRRAYDSSGRQAKARQTRATIIAAAAGLFAGGGYGPTTMEAIARQAGVAVQTVYATFRTKGGVVAALRDDCLTGDDRVVAVRDRSWYADMLAAPDIADRLTKLAAGVTLIQMRTSFVNQLIRAGAGTDPELAALLHLERRQRRQSLAPLATGLAHDLPRWDRDELLDTLWSLVSPELHELVVTERKWTAAHYQRWLGQTLSAVILSR